MFNQVDCNHGGELPIQVKDGKMVSICDCLINNITAERERQLQMGGFKNV